MKLDRDSRSEFLRYAFAVMKQMIYELTLDKMAQLSSAFQSV